jgi:hypothetical protein
MRKNFFTTIMTLQIELLVIIHADKINATK